MLHSRSEPVLPTFDTTNTRHTLAKPIVRSQQTLRGRSVSMPRIRAREGGHRLRRRLGSLSEVTSRIVAEAGKTDSNFTTVKEAVAGSPVDIPVEGHRRVMFEIKIGELRFAILSNLVEDEANGRSIWSIGCWIAGSAIFVMVGLFLVSIWVR